MIQGKIISYDPGKLKVKELTLTYFDTIEDDQKNKYFILGAADYLEIDTKMRSPVDRGFDDNARVGDEVSFEFITWKGINVITKIELTKLAKRIWY
ncbi:MAG: hypothetical protein HYW85_05290 [Deltaproteobacteria bacterium]|nr:hypothetical protein [Deltaproteobacteria bacterium]MBI3017931.1 hypothetical protein [Deltaproteobacteria bacterium]